jgi:hypothetical protein
MEVTNRMKPKTKPEPTVQIRISVPKSLADACDLARKQSKDTPYDWNATMAEAIQKANTEFVQFLANSQPKPGLTSSQTNGVQADRA